MIVCPNYIEMGIKKKKKYYLNLNNYRNWQFIVSNNLKIKFKELIYNQIKNIQKIDGKIKLQFTYYARSKLVGDLENHCIVVDKFLQDALVEQGIIPEDNCKIIVEVTYIFGGIDKENPRVDCVIINKNSNDLSLEKTF